MNEQLIKFIELCLADGIISDKEREVIFRKAKVLGVDDDELSLKNNKINENNYYSAEKYGQRLWNSILCSKARF